MRSVWLMYHDISRGGRATDAPRSAMEYHVEDREFRSQCGAIRRSGRALISAGDFARGSAADSVVITFDDGWAGVLEAAVPALQEIGARATVFVTRDFIGRAGFLSESQLRAVADAGMEVGVHGTTHRMLSECSPAEISREFGDCKAWLEDLLGRPVEVASAPGGAVSRVVAELARQSGLKCLGSSVPGVNNENTSLYQLRRVAIRRSTTTADVARYCDYRVGKERFRSRCLQIPRQLIGMRTYTRLRRLLLDGRRPEQQALYRP